MERVGRNTPDYFIPSLFYMNSIYLYVDFREYLHDFYSEKKKKSRFSFREFSRLAGFSSPVFIKLVIEGKANLRKASIVKLSNAMGLKKDDRRYFRNLVLFDRAKDLNKKMKYLEILKGFNPDPYFDEEKLENS